NEKLQQFFNRRVLVQEQKLYESEGLLFTRIDFVDNQDVIDLIEGKNGILNLLDEESRLPQSSEPHFVTSLFGAHGNHESLSLPRKSASPLYRKLRDDEGFVIRHFAGVVCYQVCIVLSI